MSITNLRPRSVSWIGFYESNLNGNITRGSLGIVSQYNDSRTHDGPVTDYRGKIRRLESATTRFDGTETNYRASSMFYGRTRWKQTSGSQFQEYAFYGDPGFNIGSPSSPTLSLSDANIGAMHQFISRANKELRSVQSLVSLGEIGELARMIKRPGQAMFSDLYSYLSLVKKRVKRARIVRSQLDKARVAKVVSDTWLEYAFGWTPTVSDIKGAADALAKVLNHTPPHKVVTAKAGREVLQSSSNYSTTRQNWTLRHVMEERCYANVRYKGCVFCPQANIAGNLQQFGISLFELVPTIYELIPYSFLVDYFSNLGDVIEAVCFQRASLAWVEKGTELRVVRKLTNPSLSFGSDYSPFYKQQFQTIIPGGEPSVESRTVHRENYTGSLVPPLRFEIPGLGLKWLNIAALVGASRQTSRALLHRAV